jgi:large subunit ribosomal protein L19
MGNLLVEAEKEMRKKRIPNFRVGDVVDVHIKIKEGDKERIQIFNGIVIARKGGVINETFTVRRIVQGEGVERIFPIHSPLVVNVVVKKRGKVKRAKLYYLRGRTGKSTRVREQLGAIPGAESIIPEEPKSEQTKISVAAKPQEETKTN